MRTFFLSSKFFSWGVVSETQMSECYTDIKSNHVNICELNLDKNQLQYYLNNFKISISIKKINDSNFLKETITFYIEISYSCIFKTTEILVVI